MRSKLKWIPAKSPYSRRKIGAHFGKGTFSRLLIKREISGMRPAHESVRNATQSCSATICPWAMKLRVINRRLVNAASTTKSAGLRTAADLSLSGSLEYTGINLRATGLEIALVVV
jgi:hypothetical protein